MSGRLNGRGDTTGTTNLGDSDFNLTTFRTIAAHQTPGHSLLEHFILQPPATWTACISDHISVKDQSALQHFLYFSSSNFTSFMSVETLQWGFTPVRTTLAQSWSMLCCSRCSNSAELPWILLRSPTPSCGSSPPSTFKWSWFNFGHYHGRCQTNQ